MEAAPGPPPPLSLTATGPPSGGFAEMGPAVEKLFYDRADERRPEGALSVDEIDEQYERQV